MLSLAKYRNLAAIGGLAALAQSGKLLFELHELINSLIHMSDVLVKHVVDATWAQKWQSGQPCQLGYLRAWPWLPCCFAVSPLRLSWPAPRCWHPPCSGTLQLLCPATALVAVCRR